MQFQKPKYTVDKTERLVSMQVKGLVWYKFNLEVLNEGRKNSFL